MSLIDWVDRFAFWEGIHPDLQTLLIYGIGIAVYTALVFAFYNNISRRDPLHSGRGKRVWARVLHGAETALTFPILSFGYFALLSLALFLMAKPTTETAQILLLSMAAVLGVRVTAHVSEPMSNDIAKLLPLSLLAVVLVDPGYLSLASTFARVGEAFGMTPVLAQYFVLFILVEAGLRAARAFLPGLRNLASKVEHRRKLSKKAMLRDVIDQHEHGLFHRHHHEHAARDRSRDFMTLDERTGGKPGTRQGVGPAIQHELKRAKAAPVASARPAPKAGPGGKGGQLGSW
jgi:hypothetical protein